jgi:hypothetical protein
MPDPFIALLQWIGRGRRSAQDAWANTGAAMLVIAKKCGVGSARLADAEFT